MGKSTKNGFVEYRHVHCKGILSETRGITFRFDVNQQKQLLDFSWTVCTEKDNFSRAQGRHLSEKFAKDRHLTVGYNRDLTLMENAVNAMKLVVIAHNTSPEFKNKTMHDSNQLKLYREVVRALETLDEVRNIKRFTKDILSGGDCHVKCDCGC